MTAWGVTETGYLRPTVAETTASVVTEVRGKIAQELALDETTVEGNIVAVVAAKLGEAWEGSEGAYHALDPDGAMGDALVSMCELTGTHRRTLTRATVLTTCTLAVGGYPAQSLVACEDGVSSNRWRNISEVIVTVAGAITVPFEAETPGAAAAVGAGDLEIAETYLGWSAIANAAGSTPGTDLEGIEALRARRRREVRIGGSATLGSIAANVSQVDGVLDVLAEENTTSVVVDSIPAHGIRINVWDGLTPAAADEDLARAIGDKLCGGTPTAVPGGSSVDYTTEDGRVIQIGFSRVANNDMTVTASVAGGDEAAIIAAIISAMPTTIGETVSFFRLAASPFGVSGVTAVTAFELNGSAGDFTPLPRAIATLVAADVTVTSV
jgi:hypothetical protein